MSKKIVIVEVLGGVAEITQCPDDVEVILKDYDNFPSDGLTK